MHFLTVTLILSSHFAVDNVLARSKPDYHINYVGDYHLAQMSELWEKQKRDTVPEQLIKSTHLGEGPNYAYARNFPKAFYQEADFLVCFKDCSRKDARSAKAKLEQQNVYYWLNQFYAMTKERFDLMPTKKVRVMVDRDVKEPGSSKKMQNNAFFNPADGSLSFLPASRNPLAKLLGAQSLNRSGFDPSVVAHEAGHSLFHALFPNAVNQEIDGFNEGFADYMANVLLSDPKVGVVMLRGKALRDSSSMVDSSGGIKTYVAGQEVHDMGERFAAGLWLSRQKVKDTQEFDHLVISAVKDISANPFATGHGFKEAFLKRVDHLYPNSIAKEINELWEFFVPGQDRSVKDTSFLKSKGNGESFLGLKVETKFSEAMMRDMGIEDTTLRYTYVRTEDTADGFKAHLMTVNYDNMVTPYWIVIDPERHNALAAYRLDGSVADSTDAESLKTLVKSIHDQDETLAGFIGQAQLFTSILNGTDGSGLIFKILSQKTTQSTRVFNGEKIDVSEHQLELKRRLIGSIAGIPKIKKITAVTADMNFGEQWPSVNGESIIGLKMTLDDGTESIVEIELIK